MHFVIKLNKANQPYVLQVGGNNEILNTSEGFPSTRIAEKNILAVLKPLLEKTETQIEILDEIQNIRSIVRVQTLIDILPVSTIE